MRKTIFLAIKGDKIEKKTTFLSLKNCKSLLKISNTIRGKNKWKD